MATDEPDLTSISKFYASHIEEILKSYSLLDEQECESMIYEDEETVGRTVVWKQYQK